MESAPLLPPSKGNDLLDSYWLNSLFTEFLLEEFFFTEFLLLVDIHVIMLDQLID